MEKLKSAIRKVGKKEVTQERGRQTVVFQSSKKNLAYYDPEVYDLLKQRKTAKVFHNERDATPKPLTETDLADVEEQYVDKKLKRTESLWDSLVESVQSRRFTSMSELVKDPEVASLVPDLDDICGELAQIDTSELFGNERNKGESFVRRMEVKKPKNFIEIRLTETENFNIFEMPSLIVPKGTDEAVAVEQYNSHYKNVTKGDGMSRPKSEAEAQTNVLVPRSKSVNTEIFERDQRGTHVSNYVMFQDYLEIDKVKDEINRDEKRVNVDPDDEFSNNFQQTALMMERMLAENVYRVNQLKFRGVEQDDSLADESWSYQLEELWSYKGEDTRGKEVVDMCWCPANDDLLAVAYGAYHFRESKNRIAGAVLIWSIKNPVNPERSFRFKTPVTSIAFSKVDSQFIAVGMYNGDVQVFSITENPAMGEGTPIARSSSAGSDPIWSCLWIGEFIFTASRDGRVMKYKFGSGPTLIAFPQMRVERVDGMLEGVSSNHRKSSVGAADCHSQALCMTFHPVKPDIYFVGTAEGCVHVCSTNLSDQHLSVSQAHKAGVLGIEFSPFSPKVFLTTGSDFVIRIWVEGIAEPVVELEHGFEGFHNVFWSPINSTLIISCTKSSVQVWDLRRKNGSPALAQKFSNNLTVIKFSTCGRFLTVGDVEGTTHVCSLLNFPRAPHLQLDALVNYIQSCLIGKPDLLSQVKIVGFE